MNFSELSALVKQIKKRIPCPSCKENYTNEGIRVIGTMSNEGFFHATCSSCEIEVVIDITLNGKKRKHRSIKGSKQISDIISEDVVINEREQRNVTTDDVIEMHNFLKGFDGDFKNIIS